MTAEKVDAWMPMWIGAYLADTMALTRDQHGGYLLLLFAYWRNRGPLPDDDQDLAAITKSSKAEWKALKGRLARFFVVEGGVWRHVRADKELAAAVVHKTNAVNRSKKALESRWPESKNDASRNATSSPPSSPPSNASGSPPRIASSDAQAILERCPTPSPLPMEVELEGVNQKSVCVVLDDTHTKISEKFIEIIRSTRPELNPDAVYAGFLAHYRPELRTEARWRKWVELELVPKGAPVMAAADPNSRAAVEAAGVAVGLGKWDELREPWAAYKARVRGAPVPGEFV